VLTNEHPLGKAVSLEVFVEHGGVLNLCSTVWVGYDRVVEDFRAEYVSFGWLL
jgi:hypothetical protein